MRIDQPWVLLLLLLALPVLWWGWRRSLASLPAGRSRLSLMVRVLLLLLVTLGLAGIDLPGRTNQLAVLFLVDRSRSVSETGEAAARDFLAAAQASRPPGARAGVLEFAAGSEVVVPLGSGELSLPPETRIEDRESSDLAGALEVASALLPADAERRIVLLSDGVTTDGRPAAELLATASSASIDAFDLGAESSEEVGVASLDFPGKVDAAAPFDASARIFSDRARPATLRVYRDQLLVREERVDLQPGLNNVPLPNLRGGEGFAAFDVVVEAEEDTVPENNRSNVVVASSGKPRVLVIDPEPAHVASFVGAVRNEGFDVTVRPPAGFPADPQELRDFDLVVLSDTPVLEFETETLGRLAQWVRNEGGGLLMAGGEGSFGAGGFLGSPIESVLPVALENEDRIDSPVAALMIVLDRSGSMAAMVEGRTKMSLADEGAVQALELLQSKDLFGLTAVDTRSHVVVPLSKAVDKTETADRIRQVTSSGGGIYIFTALADAFRTLRDAEAAIKHIILFADAADAEEKATDTGSALDLASAMLGSRITTSVVALGRDTDADVDFLRTLSERGGGRFYLTENALALPRLFSIEAMRATQSSAVERPFFAAAAAPSDLTAGIRWAESPLLLGFNKTSGKPGAEILLKTEDGYPLLATWRASLGRTAAFTSDLKNRWAAEWQIWPEAGKFWAQLARGLARPREAGYLDAEIERRGDGLVLVARATGSDGEPLNGLDLQAISELDEAEPLQQVAPGRYELAFETRERLLATVLDRSTGKSVRAAWSAPSAPEFRIDDSGAALLESLSRESGGALGKDPANVWRRESVSPRGWIDLSPWFFAAALLLLPVDIAIRRWPVQEFAPGMALFGRGD